DAAFPMSIVCAAPAVVGKLGELVSPVTYAAPVESTAIAFAWSLLLVPRNVEYCFVVAVALSFVTQPSCVPPRNVVWYAPAVVGKPTPSVEPVTYTAPTL